MLTACDFCLCLLSRLRFLNMKDSSPADPTFHKIGLFEIKVAYARNDRAGVRKQKMKLWILFKLCLPLHFVRRWDSVQDPVN